VKVWQVYSEEAPRSSLSQVNWVLANAQAENIASLVHDGDVVDSGEQPPALLVVVEGAPLIH
jgi:hypothetical protein